MQTPRKRTALFAAVAVGAVTTMGLGFALWTEQLDVTATVNTGELAVAFANPVATGDQCVASVGGSGLVVTLTDAVPGSTCAITTQIANAGTVDAVVTALNEGPSSPGSNGKITITRTGGPGVDAVIATGGASPGPTYTVAVDPAAGNADVAQNSSYTIGASIDFANATP